MEVFGPFDLVNKLETEGQELGLIIDLTYTTRYYKPEVGHSARLHIFILFPTSVNIFHCWTVQLTHKFMHFIKLNTKCVFVFM